VVNRQADVAVLGAGPTGLSCALTVAAAGLSVALFEAAPMVGGLARGVELWGGTWPLGSHVFEPTSPEVDARFGRAAELTFDVPLRRAVLAGGRRFEYPFGPASLVRALRPSELVRAGIDLATARRATPERTLEDAVVGSTGRFLYEELVAPYVEKLQGRSGSQIEPELAAEFTGSLVAPSPLRLLRAATRTRRRAGTFREPVAGLQSVWDHLAADAVAAGAEVHLASPVRSLRVRNSRVVGLVTDECEYDCETVVSTVPVSLLRRLLPAGVLDTPAFAATEGVRYRNTVLVYLLAGARDLFPEVWVALYDPGWVGRVANLANVRPADGDPAASVLVAEVWCDLSDPAWSASDADLAGRVADELRAAGLLPRAVPMVDQHVVRATRTHPVYELGVLERVRAFESALGEIDGLECAGRAASFSLATVGGCMQQGIDIGRRIISRAAPTERPAVLPVA
jgi:protoporphyrinogen oxidase